MFSLTSLIYLAMPIGLVIAAGALVVRRGNPDTAGAVEGHTPRSHPQIFPQYLPAAAQLVFSSSQGISLVSIPDGRTTGFWELAGAGDFYSVLPAPGGEALVVIAGGDGLYYIPLPPGQ